MCQIARKSTGKVNFFFFTSFIFLFLQKWEQSCNLYTKNSCNLYFFLLYHCVCKEQLDTFDSWCDVLREVFCNSRNVICGKVARNFLLMFATFLWRGCVIFFGEVAQLYSTIGCMIFLLRGCGIFVWRGCMIFLTKVDGRTDWRTTRLLELLRAAKNIQGLYVFESLKWKVMRVIGIKIWEKIWTLDRKGVSFGNAIYTCF